MNKKAILIGTVAAIIVTITLLGLPQTQILTKNEKLGLVINTPTNQVTLDQLKQVYSEVDNTNIGRGNLYLFWNQIEPEQMEYNWKDTDVLMSLNKKNNIQATLYFSIINGRTIGPYPDWMGTSGFGTLLEQKATRTLDTIITRYGGVIDTVIIGGELDAYFDDADGSVDLYKESFKNIYSELKQKHPNIKMGNAFSLNNVLNKNLQNYVTEFAGTGDFVAFTYLPVDRLNDITKTPSEARADLERAIELVPDNKIAFFEISWSTSDLVSGDEKTQVEFIKLAYDFYRQNKDKIEFFNWYRQFDRPEGSCIILQQFQESQGVLVSSDEHVRERLGSYICEAGLIKTDNTKKLGWTEFKTQVGS